jgi:diguanylate cyclase (GGDEF)-like protein
MAERLMKAVADPVAWHGHALIVSASIGIARSQPRSVSLASILRRADEQLYRAKASGKNQVRVQTEDEFPELPFAA